MLKLTPETKDLGNLKFGRPYPFTFEVTNDGKERVEITKIGVGCTSCTKASTDTTLLDPGQKATVQVVFTPGTIGNHNKYVKVFWNRDNDVKFVFTAITHA